MSARLDGRRALVTGATGGLGAAVARAFVSEGARVALLARESPRLDALGAELGDGVAAVAADVGSWSEVSGAVSDAAEALGGLDAVVNAAAIDTSWKPVGELPVEEWDRAIAVNLSGTFYVCRAALPLLGEGGAIVNFTSVAGLRAWEEDAAYNASKAGVELLTRTIAVEYGSRGIRANCLAPGVIDAGMTDIITDAGERAALVAKQPLGRMGRADEVAEAAVWLVSEASSFTTGATLTVDGGFLA
jgi:NAD(P)-dependent dehydrogenase (short-subunit alcohol dehydrogenase family)